MADQPISDADVQSLAQKMAEFNQTLTPGEQAALAAVVLRGTPQAEDVEGFSVRGPFGGQNVGTVGIQTGDPFSPISNIFGVPGKQGLDRPGERH